MELRTSSVILVHLLVFAVSQTVNTRYYNIMGNVIVMQIIDALFSLTVSEGRLRPEGTNLFL